MNSRAVRWARTGKPFWKFSCLAILMAVATPAASEKSAGGNVGEVLTGSAIQSELTGKELGGVYPSGVKWMEKIHADGSSDYTEEGKAMRKGRWWLAESDFCFTYGEVGSGGCFQVVKQGRNCYELYFVEPSEAQNSEPRSENKDWNGKLWRTEEPTTCEMPTV